jgi:hypothetical protein
MIGHMPPIVELTGSPAMLHRKRAYDKTRLIDNLANKKPLILSAVFCFRAL